MRRPELCLRYSFASRSICTLASSSSGKSLSAAPPVIVTKTRTRVDGSFLLLSSLTPDSPSKAWLGRARQVTRYTLTENKSTSLVSLEITNAMRRFSEPIRGTNVAQIGARWNPYIHRRPRPLHEMLMACLASPEGVRGLLAADVVAGRDLLKRLMFPHKASFNACFVHGVLFLEDVIDSAESPVNYAALHREAGFLRASTGMYTPGWTEPSGRTRHTLHAVVARPLGGLNLLMSGSVDCVKYRYSKNPAVYMQFVTRPLREGKYTIYPRIWRDWYIRTHLMGIRALYLGLIDEAGVLRNTRRLATRSLPKAAAARGGPWDPEDNIHWAFRVLTTLRDFCQEANDRHVLATKRRTDRRVWRVDISPIAGETRVLVRDLPVDERRALQPGQPHGIVPDSVIKVFDRGYA
ncbi:hypothetical protein B0H15DRAFT_583479 [Mycena belliarum]|uniref:Decapping nuclease n=1 Tax=Mycena belliarum TaxID=1033014 RepID=A0AAD6UD47_9AGAR|nr:hypothetical protein B0H15DRAFT_583479 [Mycena belliae]